MSGNLAQTEKCMKNYPEVGCCLFAFWPGLPLSQHNQGSRWPLLMAYTSSPRPRRHKAVQRKIYSFALLSVIILTEQITPGHILSKKIEGGKNYHNHSKWCSGNRRDECEYKSGFDKSTALAGLKWDGYHAALSSYTQTAARKLSWAMLNLWGGDISLAAYHFHNSVIVFLSKTAQKAIDKMDATKAEQRVEQVIVLCCCWISITCDKNTW